MYSVKINVVATNQISHRAVNWCHVMSYHSSIWSLSLLIFQWISRICYCYCCYDIWANLITFSFLFLPSSLPAFSDWWWWCARREEIPAYKKHSPSPAPVRWLTDARQNKCSNKFNFWRSVRVIFGERYWIFSNRPWIFSLRRGKKISRILIIFEHEILIVGEGRGGIEKNLRVPTFSPPACVCMYKQWGRRGRYMNKIKRNEMR